MTESASSKQKRLPQRKVCSVKTFIVLVGQTYYSNGWNDYAGEADTLEEAKKIAEKSFAFDDGGEYRWYEIIDLRIKQVVLERRDSDPAYDPRSS